jgi:DNA-binding response OmpR family regulator
MKNKGNILLVDDEYLFCKSTADLLQKSGYNCDCGSDGLMASQMLMDNNYDLMISDIRMRGNHELELINDLKNKDEIIPVILVTGYPSLKTAIDSIQLPVVAYMVKPLDFKELEKNVDTALKKSHFMKILHNSRETIKSLDEELSWTNNVLKQVYRQDPMIPLETFVSLTTKNIINSALNLNELLTETSVSPDVKNVCHLYDCPRLNVLQKAIQETVDTLEKTKKSFKSKELASLRRSLELLLDDIS